MKKAAPFLFLILLFIVGGWYFFTRTPEPIDELPQESAPPPIAAAPAEPQPEPEKRVAYPEVELDTEPVYVPEPLPLLQESDAEIKPDKTYVY